MSAILHLARTDIRAHRLALAAWLILAAAARAIEEVAPIVAFSRPDDAPLIGPPVLLLAIVRFILTLVVVGVVVQETPLVGRRAFWMTRPFTAWQVIAAKFLTLWPVLVVAPALFDAVVLAWRGLPLDLVAIDALSALAGWRVIVLLMLVLAAALTVSIVGYLASLVSAATATIVALIVTVAITAASDPTAWETQTIPPPPIPDTIEEARSWLGLVLTFVVPLVVLVATRRRLYALVALALAFVPIPRWPPVPPGLPIVRVDPPAWSADSRTLHLGLASNEAALTEDQLPERTRSVLGGLHLGGVPEGWFADVAGLTSRFTLADGATIEGRGITGGQGLPSAPGAREYSRYDAWQAWVGADLRPPRIPASARRDRAILAQFGPTADVSRLTRAPVRYEADAQLDLWRYEVVATVAHHELARIRRGQSLLEIVAKRRQRDAVTLLVRQTSLSPWLRPALQPQYFVALRAPDRAQTLSGDQWSAEGTLESALSVVPMQGGIHVGSSDGVRTGWWTMRFRQDEGDAVSPDWLDRAEVVIVESRFAGRVSRTLRIEGLVIRDDPGKTVEDP